MILWALIGITLLFGLMLFLQSITGRNFCTICVSVSLTWITLLILYFFGLMQDAVLLALLMGQSIIGLYYMLEKKVAEPLKVFRLPFLLTSTVLVYAILLPEKLLSSLIFLAALWVVFGTLYVSRDASAKKLFFKIIDCCKGW